MKIESHSARRWAHRILDPCRMMGTCRRKGRITLGMLKKKRKLEGMVSTAPGGDESNGERSCLWSRSPPQFTPETVLRVNRCPRDELHRVGRPSQLHIKLLQQQSQGDGGFHEGELVPNTLARPPAKRQKRKICDYLRAKFSGQSVRLPELAIIAWLGSEKTRLKRTSFGYKAPGLRSGSKPAQPSVSLFFWTKNLSGSNSLGRSQKYGDLCKLYT